MFWRNCITKLHGVDYQTTVNLHNMLHDDRNLSLYLGQNIFVTVKCFNFFPYPLCSIQFLLPFITTDGSKLFFFLQYLNQL